MNNLTITPTVSAPSVSLGPKKESLNFFSPSSIVAIFNAAITTSEEKKIIQMRGIFIKQGTAEYGGYYYDRLKDEAGDYSIRLITSALIHNKLNDNRTIEFNGFITRKIDKQGKIELTINFMELLAQRVNMFSEEETKKIHLINKKVDIGFRDLDAHIKNAIFNNKRVCINVITGKSAIIDTDIKKGMGEAIALYDVVCHRVSLSAPQEIIEKIRQLDALEADILCVARGGGENLEVFENLELCGSILGSKTIVASAIGHAQDVSLFEKLADKKFITPTHFGTYLREIYNSTIEELEKSKAKIVHDVTSQLTANYAKQIQNLTDQINSQRALHEKALKDTTANYSEQVQNLNAKLRSLEEVAAKSNREKETLHGIELKNLRTQLQASKDLYEKTIQETKNNYATQLEHAYAKLKSYEELSARVSEEEKSLHAAAVASLRTQFDEAATLHRTQLEQASQIQAEKLRSLCEQIEGLQNQQSQKDNLLQQANTLATRYEAQLRLAQAKSRVNVLAVIAALLAGAAIGYLIFGR